MMTVRLILTLRDRIEPVLPHDAAHFPFANRDACDPQFPHNLPTSVGVVARMECFLDSLDQFKFFQSPTRPILFLDSPLAILLLADSQHFAHLSHAVAGVEAFHRLAFQSRARIKMCRDFFWISTFSLSSINSFSFCLRRFSISHSFRFMSPGSCTRVARSMVFATMGLGRLFLRRYSLTHLHTVLASIPSSSATAVADFPEFNI